MVLYLRTGRASLGGAALPLDKPTETQPSDSQSRGTGARPFGGAEWGKSLLMLSSGPFAAEERF